MNSWIFGRLQGLFSSEQPKCMMELVHQGTSMTPLDVNPLLKGSLDSALISLCDRVEVLAPGSIAGLTICNPPRTRLERAIFPRLPRYAAEIVEIPLSPNNFGSCVRAVACGEIITCPDIANEQRFDPAWQNMNLRHGSRSLPSSGRSQSLRRFNDRSNEHHRVGGGCLALVADDAGFLDHRHLLAGPHALHELICG